MSMFDKLKNYNVERKQVKTDEKITIRTLKTNNASKYGYCWFDDVDQTFYKQKSPFDPTTAKYDYSSIASYEPIVTGTSETKHHGITRALVGGALAGGAGAVVGAITGGKNYDVYNNVEIVVQMSDYSRFHIQLLASPMKADSFAIKTITNKLEQLCIKLDRIISENKKNGSINASEVGFANPQPDITNHTGLK